MQPDRLPRQASFVALCRFVKNAEISTGSDPVRSDLLYSDLNGGPRIWAAVPWFEVLARALRAPNSCSRTRFEVGLFVTGGARGT